MNGEYIAMVSEIIQPLNFVTTQSLGKYIMKSNLKKLLFGASILASVSAIELLRLLQQHLLSLVQTLLNMRRSILIMMAAWIQR
ncbi:MAG: hypothetical protein RLP02_38670 [Coleofasciculus sp. C2-GNP5-27]